MIKSPFSEVWKPAAAATISLVRGRFGSHYATPM
jgi:hypothetical protein